VTHVNPNPYLLRSRTARLVRFSPAKPPHWTLAIGLRYQGAYSRPGLGSRISSGKHAIQMRAALILVGLAALVVMELGTPPRTPKACPRAARPDHGRVERIARYARPTRYANHRQTGSKSTTCEMKPRSSRLLPSRQACRRCRPATTAQEPPQKNIDQQKRGATAGKSAVLFAQASPQAENFPEQPSTPIASGRRPRVKSWPPRCLR